MHRCGSTSNVLRAPGPFKTTIFASKGGQKGAFLGCTVHPMPPSTRREQKSIENTKVAEGRCRAHLRKSLACRALHLLVACTCDQLVGAGSGTMYPLPGYLAAHYRQATCIVPLSFAYLPARRQIPRLLRPSVRSMCSFFLPLRQRFGGHQPRQASQISSDGTIRPCNWHREYLCAVPISLRLNSRKGLAVQN